MQRTLMTTEELIAKYPDMPWNSGCLEDIACEHCGNRHRFRIKIYTDATVYDDGSEADGDNEWDDDSPAMCSDCQHAGPLSIFTFKDLDWKLQERQP